MGGNQQSLTFCDLELHHPNLLLQCRLAFNFAFEFALIFLIKTVVI